jgi:hypothetical protein
VGLRKEGGGFPHIPPAVPEIVFRPPPYFFFLAAFLAFFLAMMYSFWVVGLGI